MTPRGFKSCVTLLVERNEGRVIARQIKGRREPTRLDIWIDRQLAAQRRYPKPKKGRTP